MKCNLLTENLMEAVEEIREDNRRFAWILLKAGTGQGKTSAIIEDLLPYAMERGERILYLVNRKALKIEIRQRIKKYAAMHLGYAGFIDCYIKVVSYQDIEQMLLGVGRTVIGRGSYQYVVADEIHYLDSDSQFNTNTQLTFEWLMWFDANVVRIFMSATPETVENVIYQGIIERDEKIRNELRIDSCNNAWITKDENYYGYGILRVKQPILYKIGKYEEVSEQFVEIKNVDLQTDYSYIQPHVLTDEKAAISAIKQINEKEKILLFAPSITEGRKILDKLISEDMDVEYVDSSYRWDHETGDVYSHISISHKSKARILISTAVIDNGIDILDPDCHNLFIFATEREAFMQMLGRRRVREGEIVNLYIMNRSKNYLQNKCAGQQEILDIYNNLRRCRDLNEMLFILFQQDFIKHEVFRKLYFFDKLHNCFRINVLALRRAYRLLEWYQTMAEDIENIPDEFLFAKEQLSWLGISFDDAMIFDADLELEKAEKEMLWILEKEQGKEMFIEDLREMIKEALPFCLIIKNAKADISADIRGKNTSWKKMNEFLEQGGYLFHIEEKGKKKIDNQQKKTYIIQK